MAGTGGGGRVVDPVGKAGYELAFEDTFDGGALAPARWLPYYLPQWSSREAAAARYQLGDGVLRLLIEADQPPWCPEFDGQTRVSSLQTGVFAGPVGSTIGQSRFQPGLIVRQAQPAARLYTPQYGLFEMRAWHHRRIGIPSSLTSTTSVATGPKSGNRPGKLRKPTGDSAATAAWLDGRSARYVMAAAGNGPVDARTVAWCGRLWA